MRLLLPCLLPLLGCATPPPPTSARSVALGPPETRALVIVRGGQVPWYAPRFVVINRFIEVVPQYAAAPGLEQKAFTISESGRFGGVYLWESRAAAERWFDDAWHERVRRERGTDAEVDLLDVHFTVQGAAPRGTALDHHALRTDAAVSWLSTGTIGTATDAERRLLALASAHGVSDDMLRLHFVTSRAGRVGVVVLWKSAKAGHAFLGTERLGALERAASGPLTAEWFSAPVLLDAAAARHDLQGVR